MKITSGIKGQFSEKNLKILFLKKPTFSKKIQQNILSGY